MYIISLINTIRYTHSSHCISVTFQTCREQQHIGGSNTQNGYICLYTHIYIYIYKEEWEIPGPTILRVYKQVFANIFYAINTHKHVKHNSQSKKYILRLKHSKAILIWHWKMKENDYVL